MSRLRAYAQLVRLPNLPSALADVCLGFLATKSAFIPPRWPGFACLLLASGCLYCGGMVWNDYFDVEQDTRERPFRPIPSGRISRRDAARCGAALLAAGVGFAALAGALSAWLDRGPFVLAPALAVVLAAAILLYDAALKRFWAGPFGMGACRFLNVLLAASVAGGAAAATVGVCLGLVVGLYVGAVTWLARTEARVSSQPMVIGAGVLMLVSLAIALFLPVLPLQKGSHSDDSSVLFPYLLVALGFALGFPVVRAAREPTPDRVQAAVKRALICLIVLDAVLASAFAGSLGLVILVLLAPSLYLNGRRWLYAT
jgi:4-hydroxybenzoate polyprenyltransferase